MNWSTLFTAGLALAACVGVCAAQPKGAVPPPPIRVVLEEKDPNSPIGMYRNLQLGCLAKNNPDLSYAEIEAKVKPLPTGVAERYLAMREEVLFDGPKQANFNVAQSISIDFTDARCEPMLSRLYSARVSVGCELAASGSQDVPETTVSGHLVPKPPDFRAGAPGGKTPTCMRGAPPPQSNLKTVGLPVLTVENLPCFSMADAMLKVMGGSPRKSFAEGVDLDTCLWAEMPDYAGQQGRGVPVAIVNRQTADGIARLADMGRDEGVRQYMNMLPVEFQVGKPIPASRFTAEAVKAFVSQSAILTVDVDHAAMK